jgi:hypothetical protein
LYKPLPKLTPGERVVAARRQKGMSFSGDDDPEAKPYVAEPDDNEWAEVWRIVQPLLPRPPSAELEALARRRVYQAAFHSSYFRNSPLVADIWEKEFLSGRLNEHKKYLKQLINFAKATQEMMGSNKDAEDDPYGHDEKYRTVLSLLDGYLLPLVYHRMHDYRDRLSRAKKAPSNSAQPQRDLWMARLVLVWRDDCGLDIKHEKLGAFILAACQTHEPKITTVKNFLNKLRNGKIPDPDPTLSALREVGRIQKSA